MVVCGGDRTMSGKRGSGKQFVGKDVLKWRNKGRMGCEEMEE